MPELPEVETIVRALRPRLEGRRIVGFTSRWPRQAVPSVAAVRRGLLGRRIRRLSRRGKFVVFHLDPRGWLLVHLRMSGRLEWAADHARAPRHIRSVWEFERGQRLYFCDARKFGRISFTERLAATTAELGVEPLARSFTPQALRALLHDRARQIKPLLLDQSLIAGLGNIYTDEALFRAGVHPCTPARRLRPAQAQALYGAIRAVLREAIRRHGTSLDWIYPDGWMQDHLRVYGRTGQPCRNCGTAIAYLRVGQRGTHVCPTCQPCGAGHTRGAVSRPGPASRAD